jgi:hypothetical protein
VFVEFDTSIEGVARGGAWIAWINVNDCKRNPKLRAEVLRRCDAALLGALAGNFGALPGTGIVKQKDQRTIDALERQRGRALTSDEQKTWIPPVRPLVYATEPTDRWSSASALCERSPGQTIYADCDCLSPLWACYWYFRGANRVGIGVSQPMTRNTEDGVRGFGTAHEYTMLDLPEATQQLRALPGVFLDAAGVGVFDASVSGLLSTGRVNTRRSGSMSDGREETRTWPGRAN